MSNALTNMLARFEALRWLPANQFEPLASAWEAFRAAALELRANPPLHYALMLERAAEASERAAPRPVRILDHGCGSGLPVMFLAACGYTNIYGVDFPKDRSALNAVLRHLNGETTGDRLVDYDGKKLPFADASIDLVYSQQVVEHISDECLDWYFREEKRVLAPTGMAVHWVPHRLGPYDSHTRTWFLHYLPSPVYERVAAAIGRPVPWHLHLRWPWQIARRITNDLGKIEDRTAQRVRLRDAEGRFDGPTGLRQLLASLGNMPVLGVLLTKPASAFLMREYVVRPDQG